MEIVLEKERLKKLREAMQELPPQMQRAVYLRVVKELSVQEIAAVLNVSVNTVKSHLHQARRALKEKLSSVFGDVDL
jgi:RNA polymerase sigma factor (sigma-70 family)